MTMKAGKYYVGDLCYVMHDKWEEFCEVTINGNDCLEGEFELSGGVRIATYGTAYGDGVYHDDLGNEYPVDAGLIGCIRVDDISEKERENLGNGAVVTFTKDFETSADDGVIHIGFITINTKDDDEEDEEDEDYDD